MNEAIEEKEKIQEKQEKEEPIVNNPYKFKLKKRKKKKYKIILVSVITIFIMIIALSTSFALFNFNNVTILKGISIRNIKVEGLTQEQAINVINDKIMHEKNMEVLIIVNGETYSITPEQIGIQYNVEDAVKKAYQIGRQGNIIQNNYAIINTMLKENNIELEFTYNEDALNNILLSINAKLPNAMIDNTYCIEEDELIITRGTSGDIIDIQGAKDLIITSIKTGKNEPIQLKTQYEKCPEIDIEKIHKEVKTEPQNATYTTEPFEIIPHKNGIDFNIEEAKKILEEVKEEYIIPLNIIEPEIHTNDIGAEAFPNLLSSFSTKYDETNVPRSNNLKIAMSKLDGVIVMPGEVFSYNKTLGKRTASQGYQNANGFAGGKVVPMLAGGICQISSTLYNAVLYANLEIVERYNHMFQATYVEPGKDATVVYGSLDFKFKNTRNYPIMIKTKCGAGLAEIKIFGVKEDVEYDVEIISTVLNYTSYGVEYEEDFSLAPGQEKVSQYGLKGCKSVTYRILKLNGQEISRELLSTDTYSPLNKIIKRGVKQEQQQIEDTNTTITEPITPVVPETPIKPTPEPVPTPQPEPMPEPELTPQPEPAPEPELNPEPDPIPESTPEPGPTPDTESENIL